MQAIKCELCGSSNIIKQDGLFVCQHCGTKYSQEEAKALIGVVKIDKSDDIANYFTLARRYFSEKNYIDSEKYYVLALQEVPNDIEAVFYRAYCRAMTQGSDVTNLSGGYLTVLKLVKEYQSPGEQRGTVEKYTDILIDYYTKRAEYIGDQYRRSLSASYSDHQNILASCGKIYAAVEKYLKALFPEYLDIISRVQRLYYDLIKAHPETFNRKFRKEEVARLKAELCL